jgi:hypothetical protein
MGSYMATPCSVKTRHLLSIVISGVVICMKAKTKNHLRTDYS